MPKKTSRSARALQPQRSATVGGERKNAARPLIVPDVSRLASDTSSLEVDTSQLSSPADSELSSAGIYDAPDMTTDETVVPSVMPTTREETRRPMSRESSSSVATRPTAINPASRRPYTRRTTAPVNRQATLSREEEYSFIRSDLVTVFALTVLMIILLVVLAFLLPG